ncbi:MAG: VOC family protein [Armatimonadetes bacterium]|nr:VOC family protein [Armatimonadota bacterium]
MSGVVGTIGWVDLTIPDAGKLRDFYSEVVGWKVEDTPVGDYEDYTMRAPGTGAAVAGVCHARGVNADMPAQWLIYVTVADLDQSIARCEALGGKVRVGPNDMGSFGRLAVIEDPAGAVAGLIQPPN